VKFILQQTAIPEQDARVYVCEKRHGNFEYSKYQQAEMVTSKKDAWSSNAKQRCKECLPSCALLRYAGLSNMNIDKLTIYIWYLILRCYTKC